MSKYLYLPLEIVYRENDAKSLFAFKALHKGWKVIVAPKLELYKMLEFLPKGTFILKSALPSELKQIQDLKKYGHKIYSLDEEGVVTYEIFLQGNYRYNHETVSLLDGIFFWGKKQKNIFNQNMPEHAIKSHLTGNPRIELWKRYSAKIYKKQAQKLRNMYGDFLFFPTSFGIANNYLQGNQGVELSFEMYNQDLDEVEHFLLGQKENNLFALESYLDLIPDLAKSLYPQKIIIRPHPSEDSNVWDSISKKYDNVNIKYEGSVGPWALASKAMLHFKSTTSIESNLMDVNTFTFLPKFPNDMEKYELHLPKNSSIVLRSKEEAISEISKYFNGGTSIKNPDLKESEWLSFRKDISESEEILNIIESTSIDVPDSKIIGKTSFFRELRSYYEIFLVFLNSSLLIKTFLPNRLKRNKQKIKYGKRKYEGWSFEHNRDLLSNFAQIDEVKPDNFLIKDLNGKGVLFERKN